MIPYNRPDGWYLVRTGIKLKITVIPRPFPALSRPSRPFPPSTTTAQVECVRLHFLAHLISTMEAAAPPLHAANQVTPARDWMKGLLSLVVDSEALFLKACIRAQQQQRRSRSNPFRRLRPRKERVRVRRSVEDIYYLFSSCIQDVV